MFAELTLTQSFDPHFVTLSVRRLNQNCTSVQHSISFEWVAFHKLEAPQIFFSPTSRSVLSPHTIGSTCDLDCLDHPRLIERALLGYRWVDSLCRFCVFGNWHRHLMALSYLPICETERSWREHLVCCFYSALCALFSFTQLSLFWRMDAVIAKPLATPIVLESFHLEPRIPWRRHLGRSS